MEKGMQKIEPNNMRGLFRDIAELVMQEEKKEVTAVVDTLKGSQMRHAQLVDALKEKLKDMDEQFKQDIDKKIERKDFTTTKNQLRRKARPLFHHVATRVRAEAERQGWRTWVSIDSAIQSISNDAPQLKVFLL